MSPSINLAEMAVNVDVDSVGKVERQTKDCNILLSNFNQEQNYNKKTKCIWNNFPHLTSLRMRTTWLNAT